MKWYLSLKFKLAVFLVLLTVLPTMLVGLFAYRILEANLLQNATEGAKSIAVNQAHSFDVVAQSLETAINDLATSGNTQAFVNVRETPEDFIYNHNISLLSAMLDSLINQYGADVRTIAILWNDGGRPFVRGDGTALDLYGDYRQTALFGAMEQTDMGIHWVMVRTPDEPAQCVLYKPIFTTSATEAAGVVCFVLYPDYISGLFDLQANSGTEWVVVDGEGLVSASDAFIARGLRDVRPYIPAMLGEDPAPETVELEDGQYLAVQALCGKTGWRFVTFTPLENIHAQVRAVTLAVAAAIAVGVVIALGAALALYNYLNRPIQQLAGGMRAFRKGNLSAAVPVTRRDELGNLGEGFNQMAMQTTRLIDRIKDEQEEKRRAEIQFLQAQISPHFLYNTLNTAKALARKGRTEEIGGMVTSLISLLRLSSNGDELITLAQEVDYVRNYISIMEYRRAEKYTLEVELSEQAAGSLLPKFTLQPIVENCILHGFTGACTACRIHLKAGVQDGLLQISVADNGVGFQHQKETAAAPAGDSVRFHKIGMANIEERLQLHFGCERPLQITSEPGRGTTVTLTFPARLGEQS